MLRTMIALWLCGVALAVPAGACTTVAAGAPLENVVKWTTASEQDAFGFDIFRGDAESGPFTKLTATPVLGAGTTDETNVYKYSDKAIERDRTYWYYIELISTSGGREKITPAWASTPKCPAETAT